MWLQCVRCVAAVRQLCSQDVSIHAQVSDVPSAVEATIARTSVKSQLQHGAHKAYNVIRCIILFSCLRPTALVLVSLFRMLPPDLSSQTHPPVCLYAFSPVLALVLPTVCHRIAHSLGDE